MKKIIFSFVGFVLALVIAFGPDYYIKYAMSESKFNSYIERAKQNDDIALMALDIYYYFYKNDDKHSRWLVYCYGQSIGLAQLKFTKNGYETPFPEYSKTKCPKNPLDQLKHTRSLPWWWIYDSPYETLKN